MKYSFATGIVKALTQVSIFALSFIGVYVAINYKELNDSSVADVVAAVFRNIFGSLTVGGLITLLVNYIKIKSQS